MAISFFIKRDAGNTAFAQGCGTGDAQVIFYLEINMININININMNMIDPTSRHSPATTRLC